jgi:hypothetical protein
VSGTITPTERRFLEPTEWKKEIREIGATEATPETPALYKRVAGFGVKDVSDEVGDDRVLRFTISTADVDRDRDTINVDGWNLDLYKLNPVVLFAHDYRQPPVGQSLSEWVEDGKLKSDAQFADKETYPFADTIYRLYKGGFMRATSVGFLPTKWTFVEEDDRPFGVDFQEQELLEYSAVPVPSNPYAVEEARSKGIDVEPLREWAHDVLKSHDGGEGLWIPQGAVDEWRKVLDGDKRSFTFPITLSIPDQEAGASNTPANSPSDDSGSPETATEVDEKGHTPDADTAPQETPQAGEAKGSEVAEVVEILTTLRARGLGVTLPTDKGLPARRLERRGNLILARMLPDLDAETFERLFPELMGEGLIVASAQIAQVGERVAGLLPALSEVRDGLQAFVERATDETGETPEVETEVDVTEGQGDVETDDGEGLIDLDFLEPIDDETDPDPEPVAAGVDDDPLADLFGDEGVGEGG